MGAYILAIDQGTTSSRAMIFSQKGVPLAQHQLEFKQHYPNDAWVEHDPEAIWSTVLSCCRQVMLDLGLQAKEIAALGISNQRETTLIWDRQTGEAIYPAIVWQDRRTADVCERLSRQANINRMINSKTGLLLDPYFSATKIAWILDYVEGARERAKKGELLFGTIDTFLLWRLTKGRTHLTDATNASRTLLFNIHDQQWDHDLLSLFDIPENILPAVSDSAANFGVCDSEILGAEIPITGVAGDQQAATIGQACFEKGMVKSTYGTGCFVLLNTGDTVVASKNRLLTTIAYRLQGRVTYGLEGSIFVAGAAIQWLRDTLRFFADPKDTQKMALSVENTGGVYLVPAFTGLGAPYWDPKARGALLGLTRDTSVEQIVRSALEAVCYQTRDLMQAMCDDYSDALKTLRVDGGMVANDWLLQFLADIVAVDVERPQCIETSARGAACLAGLGVGIYQSLEDIASCWQFDKQFSPTMPIEKSEKLYAGWQSAVQKIIHVETIPS